MRLVVDREVTRRQEARSEFIRVSLDMDRFIRSCLKEKRWTLDDMADIETAFVRAAKAYRAATTRGAVPKRMK
jgi:hypothetical protein